MTALNLNGRKRWVDFRAVPKAGWDKLYAAFAADGIEGAIRYSGLGSESKQVTSAERQAAARHGVQLAVVGELGTGDAWEAANDFAAGQAAARTMLADLKREGFALLGGCPAADAHATAAQVPQAVQYAKGFASVWGKALAGMYGFIEVLRACKAVSAVTWHWLAGSMPSAEDARWLTFWQDNRGRRFYAGVECDINWRLDGPLPGTEDDMQLSDKLPPIKMADGKVYQPTVADALTAAVQLGGGNGTPTAPATAHPQGAYNSRILAISDVQARVIAQDATTKQLVGLLATGGGLDGDEVAAKVEAAVAKALQENTVHVDIDVSGAETGA